MKANNESQFTAYDFYDEDYRASLNWGEFGAFANHKIGESKITKLTVFSGGSKAGDKENLEGMTAFKRINRRGSDISAASDGGIRYGKRAEVKNVIVQQGSRRVEVIDVHSST